MEADDIGIHGEEVADALFEGIDLNNISQAVILGSLLESPENIKDLLIGKEFPMSRDQVLALFFELEEEGLISNECMIHDLSDGEYSIEQVIEMLNITFTRMLNS